MMTLPQFDYCDPQMNFRSYVGSTMSKEIELLYAVLAISARQLELTQGLPGNKSDEYQQNCLQILIPSLNDATKALPDTIMTSALLLRLLEEMTGQFLPLYIFVSLRVNRLQQNAKSISLLMLSAFPQPSSSKSKQATSKTLPSATPR
jgi:hypothetical protein